MGLLDLLLPLLFALLPIIAVLLLLVLRRVAADVAGLAGWLVAMAVAWLYFQTPFSVLLSASAAGVVASFPISLMVATSIFQVTLMLETGAIARVVTVVKTLAPSDRVAQILIINIGFGTILAAMGATPVSILPPIMVGLGYSSLVAIALPAIGYDALCTYALLGAPVAVFSAFVKLPVEQVGTYFARYMPVISSCIGLGMLWIVGRGRLVVSGFFPTLLAGMTAGVLAIGMNALNLIPITGIAAGLGVVLVMAAYVKLKGAPLFDPSALSAADLESEKRMDLGTAVSPWIVLVVLAVLFNVHFLPLFRWSTATMAMPVTIIPGQPSKVALFSQSYFLVLVSTLLSFPFLRPSRRQLSTTWRKWLRRAPRPVFAAAIFFAIAFILNHSGKGIDWKLVDSTRNMVNVLATASADGLGRLYPLIAPFLGLLGGFVSGSEASSIAMLTALHLSTAQKIGAVGLVVAAASGIGGGLASVISPAKLQNAAAAIDMIGEEAKVIPTAFKIALTLTAVCALMTLIWAW